jgi:hypothetical protein
LLPFPPTDAAPAVSGEIALAYFDGRLVLVSPNLGHEAAGRLTQSVCTLPCETGGDWSAAVSLIDRSDRHAAVDGASLFPDDDRLLLSYRKDHEVWRSWLDEPEGVPGHGVTAPDEYQRAYGAPLLFRDRRTP